MNSWAAVGLAGESGFGSPIKNQEILQIKKFENFCLKNKILKFIHSEKATKFCEISILLLSYVVLVKSKVEISQNFGSFSEYMNFTLPYPKDEKIVSFAKL